MSQTPDHQKQHKNHMIDSIQTTHMTLFPTPPSTFEILKGRFDPPTQLVIGEALSTRWQIRNNEQCFLLIWLPTGTQIGFNLILLPQTNMPIKPLAWLTHQIRDRTHRPHTAF